MLRVEQIVHVGLISEPPPLLNEELRGRCAAAEIARVFTRREHCEVDGLL
jgi:hypothetical protein